MIDPRTGEKEETPEEDEARQARSQSMYIGKVVERLLNSDAANFPANLDFLKRLDLSLNVMNQTAGREDTQRVKEMAWKFRRSMADSRLRPRLPPDDPIVKEMGLG